MSDNSINPISNDVRLTAVTSTLLKPQVKASVKAEVKPPVEESAEQDKSSTPIENEPTQFSSSINISVHFRVNDETNELTAFVVDRNSHRVLRSIPISEFYKMPAGELLKLAA
jgi:uncharacterized FlaG/YvyC family protein